LSIDTNYSYSRTQDLNKTPVSEGNNKIIPPKEKIVIDLGFLNLIKERKKDKKLRQRINKIGRHVWFVIKSSPV